MNKNVPNILTIARIICTPLIILLYLLPIKNGIGVFVALGVYVAGCFTDFLDGKIARKYNLITDFGKFMDQIADKFITTTAMILVLFSNITYSWLAVLMLLIVVLRDILISGIRMVAANKNVVIAADIYGKIKSFFLDIANVVLMLYVGLRVVVDEKWVDAVGKLGLALMIVGVVLSVISCINYGVKALEGFGIKLHKKSEDDEEDEEETQVEEVTEAINKTETEEKPSEKTDIDVKPKAESKKAKTQKTNKTEKKTKKESKEK